MFLKVQEEVSIYIIFVTIKPVTGIFDLWMLRPVCIHMLSCVGRLSLSCKSQFKQGAVQVTSFYPFIHPSTLVWTLDSL